MASTPLAIDGGSPVRRSGWPPPHEVDAADETALLAALRSPDWSHGARASEFERRFAAFVGVRFALLVPNGTSAIKLALLAAGIGAGDEVILPGITWPSVAAAILECGATPVAADISTGSYGLTVRSIADRLTPRTRAVIPTHLYCSQVDMPAVVELAAHHGVIVIEDAAQAVGTRRWGRSAGAWGHFGAFSFNQRKVLACGEGGCLVTNDDDLFEAARQIHMISSSRTRVPPVVPGTFKVSEFQAALATSQLAKLPGQLRRLEDNALDLTERLARHGNIAVLQRLPGTELQAFYNFCLDIGGIGDMAWFRRAISAELGLEISSTYTPLSQTRDLQARAIDGRPVPAALLVDLPNCREIHARRCLRFPHFALRGGAADMHDIANAFEKVLESEARRRCG